MEPMSARLVDEVSAQYGAAHRAVHAVGIGLKGTFAPTPEAAKVSRAAVFAGPVTVTGRFSNSVGYPVLPNLQPDDRQPDVRGFAVKFHLDGETGPDGSMDMIAMTLDRFFDTVSDFQGFLRHVVPDPHTGVPNASSITEWAHEYPAAGQVIAAYRTIQETHDPSYAGLVYHGIHTFHYEAADGTVTPARFRWEPDTPESPVESLPDNTSSDYLRRDIAQRVRNGTGAGFTLWLDRAGPDDDPNRLSLPWGAVDPLEPGGTHSDPPPPIHMGHIQLGALVADQYWDCEALAFNPARLVDGVSVNPGDQIIAARQGAYAESHTRRTAIRPRVSRLPS